MSKDESVVKSFRVNEGLFNQANEIIKAEGFAFSEVVRLLLEATIKEGRIPRSLSTKEMEETMDAAQNRNAYIDHLLDSVLPYSSESQSKYTAENNLLRSIFGEEDESKYKSNAELRKWADQWGLPDNLSVATLAELYDCGLFSKNPWLDGSFDCDEIFHEDLSMMTVMELMTKKENLEENLEKMKHDLYVRAVKTLIENTNY